MPATVRVLIADDSAELRDVVRSQLEREGIAVIAEAGDCDSAIEIAGRLQPDVVVLDASMPGGGVAATVKGLGAQERPPAVVVYSGWPSAELEGLQVAVVAKSSDPALLIAEVRRVARERPAT